MVARLQKGIRSAKDFFDFLEKMTKEKGIDWKQAGRKIRTSDNKSPLEVVAELYGWHQPRNYLRIISLRLPMAIGREIVEASDGVSNRLRDQLLRATGLSHD